MLSSHVKWAGKSHTNSAIPVYNAILYVSSYKDSALYFSSSVASAFQGTDIGDINTMKSKPFMEAILT